MLHKQLFKGKLQQISLVILSLALGQVQAAEQLKVMSFNVWTVEGTQAGRDHIVNIVNTSGADVVGFQELSDPALIANALGWHLHTQSSSSTNIISRYPILESSPAKWGAKLQLPSGKTAWVFNTHLPAYPYQPYDLRDNTLAKNETAVINSANSARGSQVTALLNDITAANALTSADMVFLTGDFNEPSHLDWTQAVADSTARSYDLKVQWPASSRIAAIGLTDSLRQLSPDPVSDKSYSWTPRPAADEVHDRIDIVYYAGTGLTPGSVANIGPADGSADTDIVYANYPSDHRAVVATFSYATEPVEAGENILTTLELANDLALNGTAGLTGSSVSINWQAFALSAGGVLSPSSAVTFTDSHDPATTISVSQAGSYILKLTVTDGQSQYSDELELRVYADACLAAKATGDWTASYYDRNNDCVVDLIDLSMLVSDWLKDNSLEATCYYTGPLVSAPTVLDGLTGTTNDPVPADHGSNATNTPHIALTWTPTGGGNNSNNQWELYNNWPNGGTGGMVYQMDSSPDDAYKTHSIIFTPESRYNVRVNNIKINVWSGGGNSNVNWTLTGTVSGLLGSGIFATPNGTAVTHQINLEGFGSETITLALDQSSGKGTYIAIDDLSFSEIRPIN